VVGDEDVFAILEKLSRVRKSPSSSRDAAARSRVARPHRTGPAAYKPRRAAVRRDLLDRRAGVEGATVDMLLPVVG
jgi:hypothetical protein